MELRQLLDDVPVVSPELSDRGVAVELYDPVAQGDDYRNMFWSEGHITWLSTYWYLKNTAWPSATTES